MSFPGPDPLFRFFIFHSPLPLFPYLPHPEASHTPVVPMFLTVLSVSPHGHQQKTFIPVRCFHFFFGSPSPPPARTLWECFPATPILSWIKFGVSLIGSRTPRFSTSLVVFTCSTLLEQAHRFRLKTHATPKPPRPPLMMTPQNTICLNLLENAFHSF